MILGLMVGSLFAVVMGPTTLDEPLPPLDLSNASIGAFLLGLLIAMGFAAAKVLAEKRRACHDGMDHTD